jgi:hypothetical protein
MANANAATAVKDDKAAQGAAQAGPPRAQRSTAAQLEPGDVKAILADAKPIAALLAHEIWAREAGVKFNTWEAVPPAGTPFENVLVPAFWANVSRRMKMGDKVIVVPRDGAFYGELVVWDAGQNWAHVSGGCQERPAFEASAAGVDEQFDIVNDPIDGFCVRRKNGAVIKKNFPNHEDARTWIRDHQKALRA